MIFGMPCPHCGKRMLFWGIFNYKCARCWWKGSAIKPKFEKIIKNYGVAILLTVVFIMNIFIDLWFKRYIKIPFNYFQIGLCSGIGMALGRYHRTKKIIGITPFVMWIIGWFFISWFPKVEKIWLNL